MFRRPDTQKPRHGMARRRCARGGLALLALIACSLAAQPRVAADEPLGMPVPGRQLDGRVAPVAEADPEGRRTWEPDPEVTTRFYRGHLLPRFERQFGQLGQYRWTVQPSHALSENVLHEEVTEAARRGVERATQRAIEDYLVEETALRFVVLSLDRRSRQPVEDGRRRPSAVRLGVGLSHGMPELELRSLVGRAQWKLELAADGELGIGVRSARSGRADVFAKFDPSNSRYSLSTRFSY